MSSRAGTPTKRADERKLRSTWKARKGGGATPLVLLADDPGTDGMVQVLGPREGGQVRRIRTDSMLTIVRETLALSDLLAVRRVAEEVDRLDTEGVAGLTVRGLGTEHLYRHRLRNSVRWPQLEALSADLEGREWRDLFTRLGYAIEQLPRLGYLLRMGGRPVAVVHPRKSASEFARLDAEGRLPEGALLADCDEHGATYGILASGTRLRLLAAGRTEAGALARYLDLDTASLEPDALPLLGLLSPAYLADGAMAGLLADARDYGRRGRRPSRRGQPEIPSRCDRHRRRREVVWPTSRRGAAAP